MEWVVHMRKRSREILMKLTNREDTQRLSQLAEEFGVSERTIRNDINDINDYLDEQGISNVMLGSNGILLVEEDIKNAMDINDSNDFYTYRLSKKERQILEAAILIQADGYTTMSKIADTLLVSRATVINDLDTIKEMIEQGNLQVESHANKGLLVVGKEGFRRTLLLQLMKSDDLENGKNSAVRSFMKGLNMEYQLDEEGRTRLGKLINEQEKNYGRFFNDASFDYIMQYLMIAMQRVSLGFLAEEDEKAPSSKYDMAKDIIKYVFQYWGLPENEGEYKAFSFILDSMGYIKKEMRDQRIIGLQLVTRQFIENVSKDLYTNLNDDFDFYENLVNHLESIFKKTFNITSRDEFLVQTVQKHPDVLKAVSAHINLLEDYVGRDISEIEIDYIVIHICAALERRKKKQVDFKVLFVCNGGVGTSQLLLAKMRNRFDFHIVDMIPAHELYNKEETDADLIISTVPLKSVDDYVLVSPMLSDEDYLRISQRVRDISKTYTKPEKPKVKKNLSSKALLKRLRSVITDPDVMDQVEEQVKEFFGEPYEKKKKLLYELLPPSHIQLDVKCRHWRQAIEESAWPLLEKGYIEERYIDAMIDNVRENGAYIIISPGFALPHEGYDMGSLKLGMNLIRLKEPVTFTDIDGEKLECKLCCCMSTVDHKQHLTAFFHLVNMLSDEQFKEELYEAKSAEEMSDIIKKYEMRLV